MPAEVADQIAAGEVVERPASVVKELVENALDAGASQIGVHLEAAGSQLIAVVDDGEGMIEEDAVCAFSRHATSKISAADDLQHIATLGFRGEALSSIAAVSRTTLVTRRREDVSGTRVEASYGRIIETATAGTPVGTRVEVAELFGNTPARRKFLKSPATEVGHVNELITRTALAWPGVGFSLRHGTRTLLQLAAVEDHFERVRQVYGDERAQAMMSFLNRGAAGCVYGWLSDPQLNLPSQRQIYTFVNRRYVRDKLVSHALVAGYSTLLMHGRFPAAVVFLEVPPDEVDVNVHPAKSEVRFRRGGMVHELISQSVQARLRDQGRQPFRPSAAPPPAQDTESSQMPMWGPSAGGAARWSGALRVVDREEIPEPGPARDAGWPGVGPSWRFEGSVPSFARSEPGGAPHPPTSAREPAQQVRAADGFFSSLRVVGQVFEGYVVCQNADSMVLIDQHAAHERVTFESLRMAYGKGAVPRQRLLVPTVVELGASESALLAERVGDLEALGFEMEPFGGRSFTVRAVPALLGDCDPAALLRDVAEELAEVGRSRRVAEAAESVLARLACHSAVRVGQSLTAQQIQALLAAMDRVDFATNCPHGRPAYIRVPRADLERWFKRT